MNFACFNHNAAAGPWVSLSRVVHLQSSTPQLIFCLDSRYQNGEKGEWCKSTLFELATRIPMYVRVPQSISGNWARGVKATAIVESVDLYPTLIDLAGLTAPDQPLAGESLQPLLLAGSGYGLEPKPVVSRNKTWALCQWPRRPSCVKNHSCEDGHGNPYEFQPDQAVMGYKIRVDDWAYIAWFGFDWGDGADPTGRASIPIWHQVLARELYDHRGDDGSMMSGETFEWDNVVADAANSALVQELHSQLVDIIRASLVPW